MKFLKFLQGTLLDWNRLLPKIVKKKSSSITAAICKSTNLIQRAPKPAQNGLPPTNYLEQAQQ